MIHIPKYSLGVGDRFAHQAKAQLRACMMAADAGADVTPVWNKSHREHMIVGSDPMSARRAADAAVRELGWTQQYFVDADHINLSNVELFLEACDFYTLDVAYAIGRPADPSEFVTRHPELVRELTSETVERAAAKYLFAVEEAAHIYCRIAEVKGRGQFVTEVSMDETDAPQTPPELLVILVALADAGVPAQTIAPKFTGRFNKGVDYVGDVAQFEREFRDDVAAIALAVATYGLPGDLKLSVHSGSDKFSIYGPMRRVLHETGAGVHLKTAGTTWLEELIGLAEAGGDGLALAQEVYSEAFAHADELCAPYATVIDIDRSKLPAPAEVGGWSSEEFAAALRHEQTCARFNPHLRQLLHVGYKVASKMGSRYLEMLETCEDSVSRNVTTNLFDRHIKPLFV
ncbi:MAG TPA: tagaturonate epimerase family protein [Bryobacteraceae bacterium]|nr:tagaturonate epimerase family protein [Bryobacteraceae bacterium]